MSIDTRIVDANTGKATTVLHPAAALNAPGAPEIHAACVNIAGMSFTDSFSIPVVAGVFGTPVNYNLTEQGGSSIEMNVNGSSTPVVFEILPDSIQDFYVGSIYVYAQDGAIKMSNYLGSNGTLTNGLLIEVKSNNIMTTYNVIQSTAEFMAWSTEEKFLRLGDAGGDAIKAIRTDGFVLKKSGTYGSADKDDYIRVTVQDDLTTVSQHRGGVTGTLRPTI